MLKKPQTQTKEAQKPKVETIEEESDPVLKSLQKKIRNINKKLNQISDLEGKDNLKPEQIEKIARKSNLLEERSRIEESATLFKQVYAENAAIYRNNQLKELEILSRAITILHFAPKVQQSNKISSLWQSLEQANFTKGTLNEAILSLGNSLKDFANDRKLQKALNTFVEEHGNDAVLPQTSHQEQIVNTILQEKQEIAKVETVPEAQVQILATPVAQPVAEPVAQPAIDVLPISVVPPAVVEAVKVEAEVKSNEQAVLSETKANNSQAPIVSVENQNSGQKLQTSNNNDRKGGYKNNYKRGEYKGNYNRERKEGDEKRQYKPKYAPKEPEHKPAEAHESDSESEPEARKFRREEIKELENDGFIVVGKPKTNQNHDRKPKQGVKYNQRT